MPPKAQKTTALNHSFLFFLWTPDTIVIFFAVDLKKWRFDGVNFIKTPQKRCKKWSADWNLLTIACLSLFHPRSSSAHLQSSMNTISFIWQKKVWVGLKLQLRKTKPKYLSQEISNKKNILYKMFKVNSISKIKKKKNTNPTVLSHSSQSQLF